MDNPKDMAPTILPREILNTILYHAEQSYTRRAFVALRLVNTHFDAEVIHVLFSGHCSAHRGRFIHSNNFASAPASLRRKYLLFRLRRDGIEPSVFAYLFQPVCARYVQTLGIKVEEERVRGELLGLVEHGPEVGWVVAHKRESFEKLRRKALRCAMDEAGDETVLDARREGQVEWEFWYARTVLAIHGRDDDALLALLKDKQADFTRRSLCFGGTVLDVTIRHGSMAAVRAVVEAAGDARMNEDKPLYRLFALAAQRSDTCVEATTLLLDPVFMRRTAAEHAKILKCFYRRACKNSHIEVLRDYLRWTAQNWKPSGVLRPPGDVPDWMNDMYTYYLPVGRSSRGEELENEARWWLDRALHKKQLFDDGLREAMLLGHADVVELLCRYMDPRDLFDNDATIILTFHFRHPRIGMLHAVLTYLEVPKGIGKHWAWKALRQAIAWEYMDWADVLLAYGTNPRYYRGTQPLFYDWWAPQRREKGEALLREHGWDVEKLEVERPDEEE